MDTRLALTTVVLVGLFGAPLPADRSLRPGSPPDAAVAAPSLLDHAELASFGIAQHWACPGLWAGAAGDLEEGAVSVAFAARSRGDPSNDGAVGTSGMLADCDRGTAIDDRDPQPVAPGQPGWDDLMITHWCGLQLASRDRSPPPYGIIVTR